MSFEEPAKYNLPSWMFNRRKDTETGKDLHLLSADLALRTKQDIDEAKNIRSWRGYRHAYSLKVRGQHTKTTGRAGKALGVKEEDPSCRSLVEHPQLKEANNHGRSKEAA
jgi:small subunit ribosomal protein S13